MTFSYNYKSSILVRQKHTLAQSSKNHPSFFGTCAAICVFAWTLAPVSHRLAKNKKRKGKKEKPIDCTLRTRILKDKLWILFFSKLFFNLF